MRYEHGHLVTTMPAKNHFDGQMHSVEWFHNGEWRRIIDGVYPLQDAEILDDTLDCGGFCFTNELSPYPDEFLTDEEGKRMRDSEGNLIPNPNSIKHLKQLTPIRILWDSADDYVEITDDMSAEERAAAEAFNADLKVQIMGDAVIKNPIWRYRIVDEINIHNEGRIFKFAVKTVEATKLLELVQCDTMTFTNYLGRNYDGEELISIVPEEKGQAMSFLTYIKDVIKSPMKMGRTYKLPFAKQVIKNSISISWNSYEIYVERPDKVKEKVFWSENTTKDGWIDSGNRDYTFDMEGTYNIYYVVYVWSAGTGEISAEFKYPIEIYAKITERVDLKIPKVLHRILRAGETRRDGIERQRFVVDKKLEEKFANTRSPEFHITRATMWEALKMVAGHVHCIPRLNWDESTNSFRIITFDELGGMEECNLKAMHNNKPIAWDVRKSLDSYCGEINTYVDNLVNTKDEAMGCIVEPYEGGWKSARAKQGELIVKEDTVIFNMIRPNMRVSKLEIKYGDKEADITKYLYEAAEYETLSNFNGSYPRTTAYALKVEQGGKEISELDHSSKSLDLTGVYEIFEKKAICNILDVENFDNPLSIKLKDLQYRITYSPISSARIVQDKPYLEDCNGYSRNYNVAGNTIESEYLGEHLKGAIARIGNDIEYRTYMFERGKNVPKPGQILDGKYIMKVTTQMSTVLFIKCTLVLCGDYNQKHEYVAIDSSIRYYDVSEKQSVERHVNYRERVVIGDETAKSENVPMITSAAIELYSKVFDGNLIDNQISWAWFKGKNAKAILLPCLSQAEGNSMIFNFACNDNYGAGYAITKSINENIAVQSNVPYGDIFGEFETLDLILGNKVGMDNISEEERKTLPDELPEWKSTTKPEGLFTTGENPLIISKDSREQLNFTYQLNSVVNRKSIILGSELNRSNPLITDTKQRTIACYWLPKKINKFATVIDVSNGTIVQCSPVTDADNRRFYLPSVQNLSGFDAESICWVDVTDGVHNAKLIIGENRQVKSGENSSPIWFTFNANSSEFFPKNVTVTCAFKDTGFSGGEIAPYSENRPARIAAKFADSIIVQNNTGTDITIVNVSGRIIADTNSCILANNAEKHYFKNANNYISTNGCIVTYICEEKTYTKAADYQ